MLEDEFNLETELNSFDSMDDEEDEEDEEEDENETNKSRRAAVRAAMMGIPTRYNQKRNQKNYKNNEIKEKEEEINKIKVESEEEKEEEESFQSNISIIQYENINNNLIENLNVKEENENENFNLILNKSNLELFMKDKPGVAGLPIKGINSNERPVYVNPKQYDRIIKRRIARARLEEMGRLSRERKPYLHESRHKHALSRPRGPRGRFLTKEELTVDQTDKS